ncbi:MAG: glycosyltransferase family 4 protein [Candidatus Methanosuratincola sp.]
MNPVLRILLLLPFAPRLDAAHGGGRVLAQFLSELVNRHKVAVLYLRSPGEPIIDTYFRDRCALVEEVIRETNGKSFLSRSLHGARLLSALTRPRPMWVTDWANESFLIRARSITREFQPDIVQAEFHVMGQYLTALDGCDAPRVIVEHEPGARAAAYLRNIHPKVNAIFDRWDKRAWKRYEADLFRQVSAIVTFTEADRRAIRQISGQTPVFVIPPGIEIPDRPLDPLGQEPPSLLFIGNFIHPPNAEAALRLTRDIFPPIHRRIPEVKLFIVGDQPPPEVRQQAGENVVVTGRVPDVTPYLDRATLFVAPLRSGGGIRIKILEALAAGKAIVATPLAIEGLSLSDGREVAIAYQDDDFIAQVLDLIVHRAKRIDMARKARAWACDHASWERSIRSYEALYASLR